MRTLKFVAAMFIVAVVSHNALAAGQQCPEEKSLKSTDSKLETTLNFVNTTKGGLRIYWINYEGKREFYSAVAAGKSFSVDTFPTHPWVATNADEDCLGAYMPQPKPSTVQVR